MSVTGVESISAGDGNDAITLTAAGTVTIDGGAGTDTITGSSSADTLSVTGVESISAGDGNDAITLTAAGTVTIDGETGNDSLTLSASGNTVSVSNVETIQGGAGADLITIATSGSVTIDGGAGNDSITGTIGADVILGGAGSDNLTGGLGADTLTGGSGADTFAFGSDGSVAGTSLDVITDYTSGTDKITFGTATVATNDTTAPVAGTGASANVSVVGGLVGFAAADDTYAEKLAAIQHDIGATANKAVVFVDGNDSYVFYSGATTATTDNQIVKLAGKTATSIAASGDVLTVTLATTSLSAPNTYTIETASTPSWTVSNGMVAKVIDAAGAQTIHLAVGAKLDLSATDGHNVLVFDNYIASALTATRSGTTVTFTDNSTLEPIANVVVNAAAPSQTVTYSDGTSVELTLTGSVIALGAVTL